MQIIDDSENTVTIRFSDDDMQKLTAIAMDEFVNNSTMLIRLLTEKLDDEYSDL